MSITITVSDEVAQFLDEMPANGARSVDEKLRSLIVYEYHRRLARFRLTDKRLSEKYGMSFAEFEDQRVTEREGYSWEVEQDAIAWDQAVDGIATMERLLLRIRTKFGQRTAVTLPSPTFRPTLQE